MSDGDQWQVLTDAQWAVVEPLLPSSLGLQGRNFQNNRVIVEAMLYRMHTGTSWRALPPRFGQWKTVWKRHRRYVDDGTWVRILTALMLTDGPHTPVGAAAISAGHARQVDTA
jgi:transposase